MEEKHTLLLCLDEKIQSGWKMIQSLKDIQVKVNGVEKLARKIAQEIKFLEKVRSTGNVKKEYLQSTNLIHLNAMVERILSSQEPIAVMKPFKIPNSRVEVDIVCDNGASWIKVIARNARALTLISLGNGEYGQKSVLDQAESYLNCASLHPHRYKPPKVIFYFAFGIETILKNELENLGVMVEGERVDLEGQLENHCDNILGQCSQETKDNNLSSQNMQATEIKVLNLDVSTLLAYVSNMTNGHANYVYSQPLLTLQAEWERSRPIKPVLDELFKDKELLVSRTAYENFMDIIRVIGGPNETRRTNEFLKRVKIVDDTVEGRIMELSFRGKIKNRSRLVFATGESTKSITVSANEGFVRAARMQGIECTVVLHEPRSLSEIKEQLAEKLTS